MFKKIISLPLHWQIFIALFLACLCGGATQYYEIKEIFGIPVIETFDFIGKLFIRGLKMLIVPLIASALITSIASLAGEKAFGRLGIKTLGYYLSTSILAIVTGLLLVNIIQPGILKESETEHLIQSGASQESVQQKIGDRDAGDVVDVVIRMIPENVVAVAGNNSEMLGLIFFCFLFGFFMTKLEAHKAKTLQDFWQALYDIMIMMVDLVMKFAPIGVFGLVAKTAATSDPKLFILLFWFFITVLCALLIHFLVTMPVILKVFARVNPIAHYRAMLPSLLTAFSTSSSSATLPITMDCLQDNSGVSKRTTSFVTPLGATVNMDGTALYECVAVIFLMQLYGHDIGLATQVTTVILALLTSIGVAGVPSASLVAISVILSAVGMPVEAIGLLMVFDRILDMCRTAVNVFSDSCGAVLIARSEGEQTNLV